MINIERPDTDFPGYHDAMEWEVWDEDGRYVIEPEEEEGDE
jgi:hypothetical protein